jgi:peptidoglycan/LPS O-acetylase OafA/YrhL
MDPSNMATAVQNELVQIEPEVSASSPYFYRPELDGLRFLAFLLVFCCHTFFNMTGLSVIGNFLQHVAAGAMFGVDLFFVLSAYLITELLRREKQATGTIDVRGFYMRRILRIWPLYFAFLSVCFLARRLEMGSFPVPALFAFLFFCGNWYMAAAGPDARLRSPVTPFWSISVEEQFYLAWPVVAKFANKAGMICFALSLWAASYVAQFALLRAAAPHSVLWFNSFVHGGAIAAGILSALVLEGGTPTIHRYVRIAIFLTGLFLFGMSDALFHLSAPYASVTNGLSAFGCGWIGVALIFFAFLGAPADGLTFLTNRTLLYFGRISYGLYVFHYAALCVVKYAFLHFAGDCRPGIRFAFALPLTILLAAPSYRWFEHPFLKLKRRFTHVESGSG